MKMIYQQKPLVLCIMIFLFFLMPSVSQAQKQDSTFINSIDTTVILHSPKMATYYSMALPGLGQAYNKKYWKIPIIYTGFGVLGYFIHTNNVEYKKFHAAYKYVLNKETGTPPNGYVERYNSDLTSLKQLKDYYRRNKEFSIILTAGWYILNVLDATVDAHFFYYDISDDLSLKISPTVIPNMSNSNNSINGVLLTFNF